MQDGVPLSMPSFNALADFLIRSSLISPRNWSLKSKNADVYRPDDPVGSRQMCLDTGSRRAEQYGCLIDWQVLKGLDRVHKPCYRESVLPGKLLKCPDGGRSEGGFSRTHCHLFRTTSSKILTHALLAEATCLGGPAKQLSVRTVEDH